MNRTRIHTRLARGIWLNQPVPCGAFGVIALIAAIAICRLLGL